jgi:predicted nucleic acid-binding protein
LDGILFDTSVYINALRRGDSAIFSRRRAGNLPGETESGLLWLSAVVLEELYVGALDGKLKKLLNKFEKDFDKINRLLVPNQNDWASCGQVLSVIGEKYGFESVRKARMTNDCLIAMTCARRGLTAITHNAEDFKVISEFRPFKWQEI